MERKIWMVLQENELAGRTSEVTCEYVSIFLNANRRNAQGLQGGKFFVLSYPFGGSVSYLRVSHAY